MWVRDARPEDAPALAQIYWRAIREGATSYSAAQRAAWAPERPSGPEWAARLRNLDVVAADDGDVLGFMGADETGYVDLAFVLPEFRGKGVADHLYAVLEGRARARGTARMTTFASRMARPFFERHGWEILRPDPVERHGVVLDRDAMAKQLTP